MSLDIGTLVGYLDLDDKAFDRKLDATEDKAKVAGGKAGKAHGAEFGKESEKSLKDKLSGSAGGIMQAFGGFLTAAAKPTAISVATGFSAQVVATVAAGLASGAMKVAHGFAAGLALLPAIAVTAGLAVGTLKVALSGVGDALKAGLAGDTEKFNEALEGMAPSARVVLREIVGVKDQLDGLKAIVQESFFAPLIGQIQPLAERFVPILTTHMAALARHLGQVGNMWTGWLAIPSIARSIDVALGHAGEAAGNLVSAVAFLPQALLPLVTVGASFLPGLTDGLSTATSHFAEFMREAERSGQLREFIQGGIDSVKSLIETGQQVGRIIGNIGDIGRLAFDGLSLSSGGLLDTIESLTERAREFFETSAGGEVLGEVMTAAKGVATAFLGTLQKIGTMIAPFIPQIVRFATSFANLKTAVLDALEPAVGFIGGVVLPALSSLMEWLTTNQPVLQGILIGLFTAWAIHAGIAAAATIAATWPLILLGVAVAALAALVITHFDTIQRWVSTVFGWVRDNWPLLVGILTGPFGVAVGFVVSSWDTIWNAGKAVFQWFVDNWQPLLFGILTGPIGLAVGFIVGSWDAVVSFVAGLPSRISGAASGMWDGIKDAFRSVVNTIIGWWNGISFTLPKIEIPGFDPPGPGSFGGFSIGGQTFSTPDIPTVHTGALVRGQGEMLAILEGGEEVLSRNNPRNIANLDRNAGNGGPMPPGHLLVTFEGTGIMDGLRKTVRYDFGGDVQVALGQAA